MATYLVDACLPKLELFAGKGSINSGISLIGPNSHNNRIRVEIGAKNKQTEVERREKDHPRAYTHDWCALEGVLCADSMHTYPCASFCAVAGRDGSVRRGRSSLGRLGSRAECRFGLGPTRLRTPDAFLQPVVATCRSSADAWRRCLLSPAYFPNFPETVSFAFSIHFLPIFLSFNP